MLGTDEILEKHFPKVKSADVMVRFGKPIVLDELPQEVKKHPGKYTRELISDMLKEMQEEYRKERD